MRFISGVILCAVVLAPALASAAPDAKKEEAGPGWGSKGKLGPRVCIAHRGASAYVPEHTEAAYRMAIEMKADFVEQDLQLTKDGVLVCLHDTSLERTTNVEEIFPDRAKTREELGKSVKTWPVSDFKLEEIKKLDSGSWFDAKFAGLPVLTFQEAIDLVKGKAGLYPETKAPEYYDKMGMNMEAEVVKVLKKNGLDTDDGLKKTPVIIQSFSPESLKRMRGLVGARYPLIQLMSPLQAAKMATDEGLKQVASYATGIGPDISVITRDRTRIPAAHKLGLVVHPYTVDAKHLPDLYNDAKTYTDFLLYEVGADGVFTNNPDQFPRYKP